MSGEIADGSGDQLPELRMTDYADQLRSWLGQAYQWQCMPYVMSSTLLTNRHSIFQSNSSTSNLPNVPSSNQPRQQPNQPAAANGVAPAPENRDHLIAGRVFEIPRLSKRLLAEVIDFGLLFFIKALVTLTVLDTWTSDDGAMLEGEEAEDADYEMAMALTANLLTIEFVHRILVILYEVWFTHQGGTPGKRTMGIRILSCTRCLPVGENRILVQPATEITFWKSLGRAFLKNMGTALLFPTFVPLMIVQHNRTLYDILCGTVVVESD